jgi:hypothetical protein
MPEDIEVKLALLKERVEKLKKLLDEPETGFFVWWGFLADEVTSIARENVGHFQTFSFKVVFVNPGKKDITNIGVVTAHTEEEALKSLEAKYAKGAKILLEKFTNNKTVVMYNSDQPYIR